MTMTSQWQAISVICAVKGRVPSLLSKIIRLQTRPLTNSYLMRQYKIVIKLNDTTPVTIPCYLLLVSTHSATPGSDTIFFANSIKTNSYKAKHGVIMYYECQQNKDTLSSSGSIFLSLFSPSTRKHCSSISLRSWM